MSATPLGRSRVCARQGSLCDSSRAANARPAIAHPLPAVLQGAPAFFRFPRISPRPWRPSGQCFVGERSGPLQAAAVSAIVLCALYAACGRFLYKRFDRGRTAYLITDHRAIVIRGRRAEARSVPITTSPNRTERCVNGRHGRLRWGGSAPAQNFGDLHYNARRFNWLAGTYRPGSSDSAQVAFWDVEDSDALLAARTRSRSHEGKAE